jgi:L-rhamnose mutarotase
MARHGFRMRLKDESCIEEYDRLHEDIGDEVRAAHTRAGFTNYSIYRDGLDLFGYFEADDPMACFARIELEPVMKEWWAKTNPLMHTEGGKPLFRHIPEVFHMD